MRRRIVRYVLKDVDVTATGYGGVYDGQPHGITVSVKSPSGASVKYGKRADKCDQDKIEYTDAGTNETVYFQVTAKGYCPETDSKQVVISQKPVGLDWTNTEFTYDGKAHIPTAATGLIGSDKCTVTVTGEQTKAGSYTATATGLSNGNYRLPDKVTRAFTIKPAKLTITAGSAEKVYDGAALEQNTYTSTTLVSGDRIESVTITGSQAHGGTSKNVASAAKIVNAAGQDVTKCYDIVYVDGALTVKKKPVKVVFQKVTKTEGDPDPEIPYTVEGLVGTDKLTGAPGRAAGDAPGAYDITLGTLCGGDDYEITETVGDKGMFVIESKPTPPTQSTEPTATPAPPQPTDTPAPTDTPEPTPTLTPEPTAEPTVEPTPTPTPSGVLLAKSVSEGKTGLKITWTKMKHVDGYDVFFQKCTTGLRPTSNEAEENGMPLVATVPAGQKRVYRAKHLRKGVPYKVVVRAFVTEGDGKRYVNASPTVHAITGNIADGVANAKAVKVEKASFTLKKNRSAQIVASLVLYGGGEKTLVHCRRLRYLSSNEKVATVSSSGKITAKGKGACKIFAFAPNGVRKTVKVRVA